jgi:hypothetical protein
MLLVVRLHLQRQRTGRQHQHPTSADLLDLRGGPLPAFHRVRLLTAAAHSAPE